MSNVEAWQALVSANEENIRRWMGEKEDKKKALEEEVLNGYSAVQLLVCGRSFPPSSFIISSLSFLIECGADLNFLPPPSQNRNKDPVGYLASMNTSEEVIQFIYDKGADFTLSPPINDPNFKTITKCSYLNAPLLLRLLIDPSSPPPSSFLSFKQSRYPPLYSHQLIEYKLDWINSMSEISLKSTLIKFVEGREIISYKVTPDTDPDRGFANHQLTEILFELCDGNGERMIPCSLKYESDISCNGSENFDLFITLTFNNENNNNDNNNSSLITFSSHHDINACIGNDITPFASEEGADEFSDFVFKEWKIMKEDIYAFILILLLHVDDDTIIPKRGWSSNRSKLLRPPILCSLPSPHWLPSLLLNWAHFVTN